jgi:hypothetical protein
MSIDDLPAPEANISDLPAPSKAPDISDLPRPEPDFSDVKKHIEANLKEFHESKKGPNGEPPKEAHSFADAFLAGLQGSSGGLVLRNKLPDTVLPDHAEMGMRIAAGAGSVAGDLPAMMAGGVFGGIAGSAVPAAGTTVGAWTGAGALPPAMRQFYIDKLQKGEVTDFQDFFSRAASIAWEGTKGAITNVATMGVGGKVGGALAKTALPEIGQTFAKVGSEIATMTTVGKGLEGEIAKPTDFIEAALLVAGLHGVTKVATEMPSYAKDIQTKLENTYAKTGLPPAEVATQAQTDPILKKELMAKGTEVPQSLEKHIDAPVDPEKPQMQEAKIPPAFDEKNAVLGEGFNEDSHKILVEPETPKKPPSEPPAPIDPNDSKAVVLSRIGEQIKPKTTMSDIYTQTIDRFNPWAKLRDALTGKEKLPANQDPVEMLNNSLRSSSRADLWIKYSPTDFATNKPTGAPSLEAIMKPFKGDLDGFTAYWMSKHAIDMEGHGIKSGIPIEAAKNVVAEGSAKYDKGVKQIVEFRNTRLKYLADAGIISEEARKAYVAKWPNSMPMARIVDGKALASGGDSLTPIKKLEGSLAQIRNPIESTIRETFAAIKIADKNRAAESLVSLAEKYPEQELIKRIKPPLMADEVNTKDTEKFLKENDLEANPENLEAFKEAARPVGKDEIALMRNGKRQIYQVDKTVAKVFQNVYQDTQFMDKVLKGVLTTPARLIRTGAVDIPDFLLRHAIRDVETSSIYSKNGALPFVSLAKGLDMWFDKGSDRSTYQKWIAAGGGMSSVTDLSKNYLEKDIFNLSKQTGLLDKVTNVVKTPFDFMKMMADAIVSAPRLAEFSLAEGKGKDAFEAAKDSRNVTVDNMRMGSSKVLQAAFSMIPFSNVRIQGMDRMVREFKEKPVATMAKVSILSAISALLWSRNKDDERYKDLPDWQKDLFWIVPTDKWEATTPEIAAMRPESLRRFVNDHWEVNNGDIHRVPKPFEMGVLFASGTERMLEKYYAHNPDAFQNFGREVLMGAMPSVIPTAMQAPIEQFSNKSFLTGGNVVPHQLEQLSPEYQYTPYTSESAKQIAKMIRMIPGVRDIGTKNLTLGSPIQVEHYARAWGGGMGMYALQLADKALEAAGYTNPLPKPTSTLADMPVVKAFEVRYPSMSSQSVQNFYDNLETTKTNFANIKHLAQTGDAKELQSYVGQQDHQENMVKLEGMAKGLGTMNQTLRTIQANPNMSPNDKRQLMDGLLYGMIQVAQMGNKIMKEMKGIKQ